MQSADGAQAGKFFQDEIKIRRGATLATLEFGAAFTTTLDWLALVRCIGIRVITRPGLSLRVLGCPSDCLHFVAWRIAVGDLHKLSVTKAALSRPQGVFRWAYLSRVIMKEDHCQFRWFVSEDLGDIRRGFPTHRLPSHGPLFKNEMK